MFRGFCFSFFFLFAVFWFLFVRLYFLFLGVGVVKGTEILSMFFFF